MEAYRTELGRLTYFFDKPLPAAMMEQLSLQYALVSASLSNFIPEIDSSDHPRLHRQILFHQKLSMLDESFPDVMQELELRCMEDVDIESFQSHPAIFCTVHMGSYRLINFLLKQRRIPYVLVAAKSLIDTERQRLEKNYNSFHVGAEQPLHMVDAENPSSALLMFRALKQGKSLLIYLDGNTGAGRADARNENMCRIKFLAQQLDVRSGAAYLSLRAKVPLVPVIACKPSRGVNAMTIFTPIRPSLGARDIKEESKKIIQQMYTQVAPFIRRYPEQWEGWLYIHKAAVVGNVRHLSHCSNPRREGLLTFNSAEFAIFKIDGHAFVLRKSDYSSFPIDEHLYDFLSAGLPAHISEIIIDDTLLRTLITDRIIL